MSLTVFSKTMTQKRSLQGIPLRHNPNKHVCSTRWKGIWLTRVRTKSPSPSPSPSSSPSPSELAYVGDFITNIGEFVVPHIYIKCVVKYICSAPDSRMITIAELNSRITVSHLAKILCLEYQLDHSVDINGELDELITSKLWCCFGGCRNSNKA